jgi:hypothetical protein
VAVTPSELIGKLNYHRFPLWNDDLYLWNCNRKVREWSQHFRISDSWNSSMRLIILLWIDSKLFHSEMSWLKSKNITKFFDSNLANHRSDWENPHIFEYEK